MKSKDRERIILDSINYSRNYISPRHKLINFLAKLNIKSAQTQYSALDLGAPLSIKVWAEF